MMRIVTGDIGGTHARFALADIADGKVVSLDDAVTLETARHVSLQTAWQAFASRLEQPIPRAAGIAVASPVDGETISFTNNPWVFDPKLIGAQLGLDALTIVNDFGAIAHAVAQAPPTAFDHVCGPDTPLPEAGVITICGPGTGFGVSQLLRRDGRYVVIETEGGHQDFAPFDAVDDRLLARLRHLHGRVSVERVVAGPGIVAIYETLAEIERCPAPLRDDRAIWRAALDGGDALAGAALDRFCLALGGVAGDLALAHGAGAVVMAGGLGQLLRDRLVSSAFSERFASKGRFRSHMTGLPVKLVMHPQPGLYGAAAAFAQMHGDLR